MGAQGKVEVWVRLASETYEEAGFLCHEEIGNLDDLLEEVLRNGCYLDGIDFSNLNKSGVSTQFVRVKKAIRWEIIFDESDGEEAS